MAAKLEYPMVDRNNAVPPQAQEVEYALILSRMISVVEDNPSEMRTMVYEFARAKLKIDMARAVDISRAGDAERKRLTAALETAIQGVEAFTARQEGQERLQESAPLPQIESDRPPPLPVPVVPVHETPAVSVMSVYEADDAPRSRFARDVYSSSELPPILDMRTRVLLSPISQALIALVLVGMVAGLVIYRHRVTALFASLSTPPIAVTPVVPKPAAPQQPAVETKTAAAPANPLPFALPNDYGVYAVSNDALSELHPLALQVPDKRIAMSAPLNEPSRTIIPDGKAKFVLYRRDLAGSAPERVDVRVVARVVRAITFDPKGKPVFSPVSDAWNIRNVSFEFRVRPIAGNPEMLLVQSEKPDFVLPAGRYVLDLKNQGYDFTVAGKITDPWQCLERTDAANGEFFSDCPKK